MADPDGKENIYEQKNYGTRFHRFHWAAIIRCDCRLRHGGGGVSGQLQRKADGGTGPAVDASATGVPHLVQNLLPGTSSAPQEAQTGPDG